MNAVRSASADAAKRAAAEPAAAEAAAADAAGSTLKTPAQIIAEAGVLPADGKAKPIAFKTAYVADDGVIYLIGAYAENIDLDDDVLRTKALVKMAHDFTARDKRTFKANHKDEIAADLVASMTGAPILKSGRTLAAGEELPDDDEIIGIDLKAEPIAWFVGVRPHDATITDAARKGEIIGASWGAYVDREQL
jgi:hypothetical protein